MPPSSKPVPVDIDLVRLIAKKLARGRPGVDFDDLVQEGCIGFIKASSSTRYDPTRSKLGTWVWKRTRYAMLDFIERHHGIKIRERYVGLDIVPDFDVDKAPGQPSSLENDMLMADIRKGFKDLSPFQRWVMEGIYDHDISSQDLAEQSGVSKSQISRTRSNAIRTLRKLKN